MAEQDIEGLIARLRDFRTRSTAADELAARGAEAVEPVLKALDQEGNQGARWVMLSVLGRTGSAKAVPAIARHLEDGDYQTVAREALRNITGRDLGPLPRPWLRWAEERGQGTVADAHHLPDDTLIELALEDADCELKREAEGRYVANVAPGRDVARKVWTVFGSTDHEGAPVVIVFANCGRADPKNYEEALRMNLKMPYGAIALRDIGGEAQFVVFNTILRAGLSPVELRKSILTVAERSERIRRQLCG